MSTNCSPIRLIVGQKFFSEGKPIAIIVQYFSLRGWTEIHENFNRFPFGGKPLKCAFDPRGPGTGNSKLSNQNHEDPRTLTPDP